MLFRSLFLTICLLFFFTRLDEGLKNALYMFFFLSPITRGVQGQEQCQVNIVIVYFMNMDGMERLLFFSHTPPGFVMEKTPIREYCEVGIQRQKQTNIQNMESK